MKHLITILTGLFIFCGSSYAQTQFSGWFGSFNTFNIDKKFSIHFDGQLRSSEKVEHIQTLLLRPGLNMKVRKNMIASVGYAFIHNRRTVGPITGYAPEHRVWEQFIINQKLGSGSLQHRFRVEQRFISKSVVENNALKNDVSLYANRFRYFARAIIPIVSTRGPFIALQDEVFLNFGDNSAVNGKAFDQNRAYIALGYRFDKSFDAEFGYMNQYISGRDIAFTNNHILQFATYIRL